MLRPLAVLLIALLFSGCLTFQIAIPIKECRKNFAVLYTCNDFDSNELDNVVYMLKKANATITKFSDNEGLCYSIDQKYRPDKNFSQVELENFSGVYLVNGVGLLKENNELKNILIEANNNDKPVATSEFGILFLSRSGILYARHSAPVKGFESELENSSVTIVERNIVKDKNVLTNLDTQYARQLLVKLVNEVC